MNWAQANDVERYRAAHAAGNLRKGRSKVETFEYGVAEQQLSGIYLLLQQLIHVTAVKGTRAARKKGKFNHWPTPRTAADEIKRQEREKAAEASREFLAMFEYVPQDEFVAELAQFRADMERYEAAQQAEVMDRLGEHEQTRPARPQWGRHSASPEDRPPASPGDHVPEVPT